MSEDLERRVAELEREVREVRENQPWNVVLGGAWTLLWAWVGSWLHRVLT